MQHLRYHGFMRTSGPIEDFARDLSAIPESDFTDEAILTFLSEHTVDPSSLAPYLHFSPDHYTRNLIHRTPLFELIAICWEPGQKSAIHNHRGQRCWMAAPVGSVLVHNFRLLRQDAAAGYCEIESTTHFVISAGSPAEVDPAEPIHMVSNPLSNGERAVTLHIYSKPYDVCEIYDLKNRSYQEVRLVNTTEYGK
ncbi:MAG: cysteine dioxygenase family protein [Bryobacteraceae bacterium]